MRGEPRRRSTKCRAGFATFETWSFAEAWAAFRALVTSFAATESTAIARVVLAARRHLVFAVVTSNPDPVGAARVADTSLVIADALPHLPEEQRKHVAAVVNVVQPPLPAAAAATPDGEEAVEASRWRELVRARVERDTQMHARASEVLGAYLRDGSPFGLLLRNFDRESYWAKTERGRVNIQLAAEPAWEVMAARTIGSLVPLVAVANNAPVRPDFDHTIPKLLLPNEHWKSVVAELVGAAAIIVMDIATFTRGVLAELAIIRDAGKQDQTLVVVRPPQAEVDAHTLSALGIEPVAAHAATRESDLLIDFPHVIDEGREPPSDSGAIARLKDVLARAQRWDGFQL